MNTVLSKSFIPLLLLTMWSTCLVLGRIIYFGSSYYIFLLWNALLAWIPVVISSLLLIGVDKKKDVKNRYILIILLFWILFLPNAPYLITDFVHLRSRNGVPIWYDVLLLLSFSLLGLFQFEYSLLHIRQIVRKRVSHRLMTLFVPVIIVLMSVGVFLGRFLRWNSWEIFTQPYLLIDEFMQLVRLPHLMAIAFVYTISTSIVLALFHYLLHSIRDILIYIEK